MAFKQLLSLMLIFVSIFSYSQKLLDLHYTSVFGKQKSFQFFNNSKFTYKLKGDLFYHSHKIVNMQGSLLVLDNDSAIKLDQIKAIRIDGMMISPYFFGAGGMFLFYDTFFNVVQNRPKIINDQALVVAGVCIAGGLIMKYCQNKHIRIKKSDTMRIIDNDYRNLQAIKQNNE